MNDKKEIIEYFVLLFQQSFRYTSIGFKAGETNDQLKSERIIFAEDITSHAICVL